VGEFVHELARALATERGQNGHRAHVAILCTSWKDRPAPDLPSELGDVEIVDRRVPVRGLSWSWNRLAWPPVEWLAGTTDVVHSQSPLLIPARSAAQVVTIHDLDFLNRPDRARAEMRRDFPRLVHDHARRADHIVVSSQYAATEVVRQLDVARDRVTVCSPGVPEWGQEVARRRVVDKDLGSTVLFLGTVDERKNVAGLLDAYAVLRTRRPDTPRLVIAGRMTAAAAVARANRPSLGDLFRNARMLVLPSFEEGFGLPVLEAMACGVPVVVSDRGSLPEVTGPAAQPVSPDDIEGLARRMEQLLDAEQAAAAISRGLVQASKFTWAGCARAALAAYRDAIASHTGRRA
jgi:glycosyltransferase involved in cell wall biosynthesis